MDTKTLFHKRIAEYQSIFPELRHHLSRNPSITMDMVLEDMHVHPSHKHQWTFDNLARTIPLDTLFDHGIYPASSSTSPTTPMKIESEVAIGLMKLSIHTLLRTHPTITWNWMALTMHPNITIEDIVAHPELPWQLQHIGNNPNFELHHYLRYPHFFQDQEYDFYKLLAFVKLSMKATFEQIREHPTLPWSIDCLKSPHVKKKEHLLELLRYFANKYPLSHVNQRIGMICENPNVSFDDLYKIFGEAVFPHVSFCVHFTPQDFYKHPIDTWMSPTADPPQTRQCRLYISKVPMDFILAHPEQEWDWIQILQDHPQVTYDTYKQVPEDRLQGMDDFWRQHFFEPIIPDTIPIEYRMKASLFTNKHLPPQDKRRLLEELLAYYRQHPPRTTLHIFLYYPLLISPLFLEPTPQEIREHFAKRRIVRHLVESLSNPAYQQCRKRLAREFQESRFLQGSTLQHNSHHYSLTYIETENRYS